MAARAFLLCEKIIRAGKKNYYQDSNPETGRLKYAIENFSHYAYEFDF